MPSVAEVMDKITKAGLVIQKNPSKHSHTMWDIVDPKSGTILTGISGHADKQGGDHNWHFNIRRILRKAGYQIEFGREGKKKQRTGHKRKPAIDLEALKKAQDQAIAAGHRPPLLEDIEGERDFLTKSRLSGGKFINSEEATGEVIHNMATSDAPRIKASVARLRILLADREEELVERAKARFAAEGKKFTSPSRAGSARNEFVHIALEEVAPKRSLRAWKNQAAGSQLIYTLIEQGAGTSLWSIELIEATMDHLNGLKWNEIDKTKIKPKPKPGPETSTAPQGAPDQTTYDVAIAMIEEYEEEFRQIAEIAGADGSSPEDWRALTDKAKGAKDAVTELRADYTELAKEVDAAQKELGKLTEAVKDSASASPLADSDIPDKYATVLLGLLTNFEADKQGNAMLDMIFTRLDKLAGF